MATLADLKKAAGGVTLDDLRAAAAPVVMQDEFASPRADYADSYVPPTEEPSLSENIWGKGAIDTPGERLGATINDMGVAAGSGVLKGATNLGLALMPLPFQSDPATVSNVNEFASDITGGATEFEPETTAGQFTKAGAEFLPGAALFGGMNPANLIKYGLVPGAASEAAGRATKGTKAEPWARLAASIAAPMSLSAAAKVITPNVAGREAASIARYLEGQGVRLTAGQKTGSNALKLNEKMTVGGSRLVEQASDDFTAAAMKSIESRHPRATRAAISEAYDDIGGMFDDLAAKNSVRIDKSLIDDVEAAVASYRETVGSTAKMPINILKKIKAAAQNGDPITGAEYQNFSSRLGKLLKSSDGATIGVAGELRGALDDALERTLRAVGKPGDLEKWRKARKLYTNLLVVAKSVSGSSDTAAMGIITPAKLSAAVKGVQGQKRFVTGNSELGPLADAGAVAFKAPYGTEAAFRNKGLGSMIGAAAGAGGIGAASSGANPMITGASIAGGVLAPLAINAAKNTGIGQSYLANQLLTGSARKIMDPRLLGVGLTNLTNRGK